MTLLLHLFRIECIDCVVDWGEWGECADGERSRYEEILVEAVGVGTACPELLLSENEGDFHYMDFHKLE